MRKSFKLGGMKVNLSKSGIGLSTGIKGLRVGVSSSGKSYISAGTGLLRNTLTSSNSSQSPVTSSSERSVVHSKSKHTYAQIEAKNDIQKIEFTLKDKQVLLLTINFIISIFLLFIPFIIHLVWFVFYSTKKQQCQRVTKRLEELADTNQYVEFKKLVEVSFKKYSGAFKNYLLFNSYQKLIVGILSDLKIDQEEQELIQFFKDFISKDDLNIIHLYFFNQLLIAVTSDNELTKDEEKILSEYSKIFELQSEDLIDQKKVIDHYKEINKIKSEPLKQIKPSLQLEGLIYLEIPCNLMKYKSVRNFSFAGEKFSEKSFTLEKEGILFVSDSNLFLVMEGTSKIPIKNILQINLDPRDEVIEILLSNRKTSLFLSTPENLKTMTVINKLRK